MAACAAATWSAVAAGQTDPDPGRFAAEIRRFAEADQQVPPPKDAVVFVGSSSIRLWPTADRFPALPLINRGFGGSHISDVLHYLDETVIRYAPAVVVFYAGDNDIGSGKTPQRVIADYREFVSRVAAARPDTHVLFIAIKPSLDRWSLWPRMHEANELVRAYSATRPTLHYVDIATPMLGPDGRPRPELFVADGLHMTPAGYDIWTDVVGRAIAAVRSPAGITR